MFSQWPGYVAREKPHWCQKFIDFTNSRRLLYQNANVCFNAFNYMLVNRWHGKLKSFKFGQRAFEGPAQNSEIIGPSLPVDINGMRKLLNCKI